MGLLKETIQAIISIDRNINEIRKALMWDIDAKSFRAAYNQKPIEPKGSPSVRVMTDETFAYPEIQDIGGRICAVRKHLGLLQSQLAQRLAVNLSYISKLELGTSAPSEMLIRLLSLISKVDETWLTTGHLPQTPDSPSIAMGNVMPLSGYGGPEDLQKHLNLQHQTRLEVERQMADQKDPQ